MSGKQITELTEALTLDDDDLMPIRKNGAKIDNSITKAKLMKSLGNSAVKGYTIIKANADKITIRAANLSTITAYCEGMKISFISPINSKDIVQVQIGTLPYISLYKYSFEETVKLAKGEYVEAIYTDGLFKQINKLNINLVWSNEYTAKSITAPDASTTTYNLRSAIGVKKTKYYEGMSLLFTVPVTSQGVTFVNVDELGDKKLGESGNSPIAKDIYENQAIMAIYDGKQFAKQKFTSIHRTPIVVEEVPQEIEQEVEQDVVPQEVEPQEVEPQEVVQEEAVQEEVPQEIVAPEPIPEPIPEPVPVDIWAPDYAGDPDDPANTTSPDALDSKGARIFEKTITVAKRGAMYDSIEKAIAGLINDYGEDGGGHKFAIEMDRFFTPSTIKLAGKSPDCDLRWITLFAQDNTLLNFNDGIMYVLCTYPPIFNFKLSATQPRETMSIINTRSSRSKSDHILTFGKNTTIIYDCEKIENEYNWLESSVISSCPNDAIEAKYGITIKTNRPLITNVKRLLLNKALITFNYRRIRLYDSVGTFFATFGGSNDKNNKRATCEYKSEIYNTVIHTNTNDPSSGIFFNKHVGQVYLRNVTSTDRTGKTIGLQAWATKVVMENCNFASKTDLRGVAHGYDIVTVSNKTIIYLKNTTGNTSIPVNKMISGSIIYRD